MRLTVQPNFFQNERVPPRSRYEAVSIFAFPFLFGVATNCYAGEERKDNNIESLTSTQLGDYSSKLETDEPQNFSAPDPVGLTTLRQETIKPFLGLKLSRFLPDNFWKSP